MLSHYALDALKNQKSGSGFNYKKSFGYESFKTGAVVWKFTCNSETVARWCLQHHLAVVLQDANSQSEEVHWTEWTKVSQYRTKLVFVKNELSRFVILPNWWISLDMFETCLSIKASKLLTFNVFIIYNLSYRYTKFGTCIMKSKFRSWMKKSDFLWLLQRYTGIPNFISFEPQ